MTDLVLLPGINNTRRTWDGVISSIPGTIVCHPMDCPARPVIEDIAADLLTRCPAKFYLAGFSFGGYVALAMLEQARERILGLALVATTSFSDNAQQAKSRDDASAAARQGKHLDLVRGPGAIALHPKAAENPEIAALRIEIATEYGAECFIAHQEASKGRPDRTALLAEANLPILIVLAEDDKVVAPDAVKEMAKQVGSASTVSLADTGHLVPLERPKPLADALSQWILSDGSTLPR